MNQSNLTNDLTGRSYINWVRCSTKGQADTSLTDQLDLLNAYGAEHQMSHVDNMILDGVSGLGPKVNKAARQLVKRKRLHDDFDAILIHDLSRLTRNGVFDGSAIENDFRVAGISLISIKDNVPDDEFGDLYKSLKHFANQQQSKAISLTSTRGSMSAIKSGKRPHSQTPPYGVDRRVLGPDGEARFILRLIEDGSQQKLDPDSQEVLEVFPPNPVHGAASHYRLQNNEDFDFVPGHPDRAATVNLIYIRHHIQGWGGHSIAKQLNDRGIPSPRGGAWSPETVHRILMNSVYLGMGLTNYETTGRFYMRSAEGPQPTNRSPEDLAKNQPSRLVRPEADWQWIEESALKDFLTEEVRELAAAAQLAYRKRKASGTKNAASKRDRHHDSPYILKHRLVELTTGRPMIGHTSRRGNKVWRSYKVSGAYRKPSSNPDIPTQMIPADAVNQMAVALLANVIRSAPGLRDILRRQIVVRQQAEQMNVEDIENLIKQRTDVKRQLAWLVDNVTAVGEDVANRKLTELTARREDLDRQINVDDGGGAMTDAQIDTLVNQLIEQLGNTEALVRDSKMPALRRLLDILLARAVADVHRRWVEFEFRLPPWALENPEALCLPSGRDSTTWREAGADEGLLLMRYRTFPSADGDWIAIGIAA